MVATFRTFFSGHVTERGAGYFRDGAVEITAESDHQITAVVRGSSTYRTGVRLEAKVADVWCSCPYVELYEAPCKHLWALILTADARGALGAASSTKVARMRLASSLKACEAPDDDDFDEAGLDDGDEFDDEAELDAILFGEALRPAELSCAIDLNGLRFDGALILSLWIQYEDGAFERLTPERLRRTALGDMNPDLESRLHRALLYAVGEAPLTITVTSKDFLERLCREKRLVYVDETASTTGSLSPLVFDRGAPFRLRLRATPQSGGLLIAGELVRGRGRREQVAPLEEPKLLLWMGLVAWSDRLARLKTDASSWSWTCWLRKNKTFAVAAEDVEGFLDEALSPRSDVEVVFPRGYRFESAKTSPQPCLTVTADEITRRLQAVVELQYGQRRVQLPHHAERVVDLVEHKYYGHDVAVERSILTKLAQLGFRGRTLTQGLSPFVQGSPLAEPLGIAAKRLPGAIAALLHDGWRVEAHGKIYRRSGGFDIKVSSGTDWFELQGDVEFEGQHLGLPELLRAVRRGATTVDLGDGTVGVLPEAWLTRLGMLSGGAERPESSAAVRVPRAQLMLLDELLQQQSGTQVDEAYARLREELTSFAALEPADPPRGFRGELRGYQRDGLSWMQLLARLGFGGCLADDMGLGKTVQVLALLLGRKERRRRLPPSLVVAPSSVVFNWVDEARRFTPNLRAVPYAGPERPALEAVLRDADLVITNYTLLRKEIDSFSSAAFDYVVLDEAQAIKNYETTTAQAARRLRSNHRVAITGTPIENHLGELGSQLEFLNPGMLGASAPLRNALLGGRADTKTLEIVQRAVRPFLLRRTKHEVAPELPERIEKTLYVDLTGTERHRYDQLLAHYRARIKDKVANLGLARSTPQVLEALLRLRQAACHPGLLDARRRHESSAKLDRLFSELARVESAGEKCLVFSQFTSLLAIVKDRLDARRIGYEYLDGKSRKRKDSVARFQSSEDVHVFLISLKAGGVGLNLTAAEHVFLLDPWWNPAAEAQAIDRTHRIGQRRNVLAYKLIARRTVEEKVIELQREKRALAQAILGEDAGLGAKLTRGDLEALLG